MIVTPFINLISSYPSFLYIPIASSLCSYSSFVLILYVQSHFRVTFSSGIDERVSVVPAGRYVGPLTSARAKRNTHKWIDYLYIYFLFRDPGPYNKPRLSHENRYMARFWSETPAARESPAHAKEKMSPVSRGSGGQSPLHHGRCGWHRWQRRWDLV